MKAIKITIDSNLLSELDATEEVRKEGRSAVFRRALADYLRRRRREAIAATYARAYRRSGALSHEFEGWEREGQWPPE
jgi:metal-responsive CopG/Arc/MetJ family transcriptional regulator